MKLTTAEMAAAASGRLRGIDVTIDGASTDSRTIRPGQMYVAIKADRDGNEFTADAVAAGAVAYLTDGPLARGATGIVVGDTVKALGDIAALARTKIPGAVIGITGSVGKTSTKDLLASILSRVETVAANVASFNNEIGTPLTLINAPDDADSAVLEMGAREIGNIAYLCKFARPTVGVVTNIGLAHFGPFGSLDAIVQTKGELIEALPSYGIAVLNVMEDQVLSMRKRTKARVLTFGLSTGDIHAREITVDDQLRPSFRLHTPRGNLPVNLSVRGEHQVVNALAAAAAAFACDVELRDIADGLAESVGAPLRMEITRTRSGATIINDSYNANPSSMRAALAALVRLPSTGKRIAVLGVMAELGPVSAEQHQSIADYAADLGVTVLAVGTDEYGKGVKVVESVEEAAAQLSRLLTGDVVLVKGSRVAKLETLVPML